ncbi:uncharacterized protein LOC132743282 [Ruditapes philippinarum]|uniref:uncharacterized protein LOC132743282 n=1 Tax=Ruditapes philippinarum TaxID=129788 RepID=UPI00295B628B|nr:uncharacterized protein LOC132743282 [Ruditapes philippinarum]
MKNETVPTVETEVDGDDDNILRMEQPDNIRDNIAYTQILPLRDDNNVAIGNNNLQSPTAYSHAAISNNIAVNNNSAISNSIQYNHPLPQLLIQNSSVGEEAVEVEEFTLTCFYCKKIFPVEDKISYIQHVQVKHLNGMNRIYRAEFLRSKFEELKRYFEQAIWHDLGIIVKICRRKDCKFIFIDMSYMIKHDLKVHKHHKYVCSIADCHRVFSSKGPLRSHEIVDHAKTATINKNEGDSNEHAKKIDNIKHFKQTYDEVSDGSQSAKKRSIVNTLTDSEKSVHNRESDQGELPEIPKKKNRKFASDIDDEAVNDFDTIDKDMVYDENEKGDPFQRYLYKHVGQAEEIPKPIKQVSNRKRKCRRKAVSCMEGTDKCNNINDNSVKYPCRYNGCSMVYISNEERSDHVKNFHIVNMYNEVKRQRKLTFKCMSVGCEKIFDTKEERKQHVQECHMLGNVKS